MKVLQPEVIKIINKLAEKYNLPAYVIEDINRAQFSYLRKMIKNAKLPLIIKFLPSTDGFILNSSSTFFNLSCDMLHGFDNKII